MSSNIYKLKKYNENSNYTDFSCDLISKKIEDLKHIDFNLFEESNNFKSDSKTQYDFLELPEKSYQDLNSLLDYFELKSFETEFLSFISITQNKYLLYEDQPNDKLYQNFLDLKKDLKGLIDILEKYLLSKKPDHHSISFKFHTEKTNTINNLFLLDDIYRSIAQSYKINKDNFHIRKEEILLELATTFNYKKGGKFVIIKVVQALFDFLKTQKETKSDNELLRFCGVFLHICQIPSNSNTEDINIGEIEDSLKLIDHQNLRHLKDFRSSSSYNL